VDIIHQLAFSETVSKVNAHLMACLPDYVGQQKDGFLSLKSVTSYWHQWDLVLLNFLRLRTHWAPE